MSRIALGTVQFGVPYGIANQVGQVSRAAAKLVLEQASAHKINTIDTAIGYGESENCLGEAGVRDFKVVTKLPAIPDGCVDVIAWVERQFEASLSRMNVDKVYGLLLHRPEQLLGLNGLALYKSLVSLKERGLVKKIGVSIYSPSELELLINNFRFDLVQAPFNVLDRRLFSTGWMQRLKDGDVEIHTRSAFLQGLLLMSPATIPSKFLPWAGVLGKWHEWLGGNKISALQASLSFPLSFPQVDRVVVGVDSQSQLQQIVSAENYSMKTNVPNFACEDENLINPANWSKL